MSLASRTVLLMVLWLLAWGDASVGNVVSGLVVAALLLVAFPPRRRVARLRVRPAGVARLVLYVLGQLVTSNYLVAREIVSRRARVRTGVLAYRVQHPSDGIVTLMANVLALTPGTMTVEATSDPSVIYVHFLLLEDVDAARAAIARVERLVVGTVAQPPPLASAPPEEPS